MLVTLAGIEIDVRPEQSEKALAEMVVVPSFNMIPVPDGMVPMYFCATLPMYNRPLG